MAKCEDNTPLTVPSRHVSKTLSTLALRLYIAELRAFNSSAFQFLTSTPQILICQMIIKTANGEDMLHPQILFDLPNLLCETKKITTKYKKEHLRITKQVLLFEFRI